MTIPDLEQLPDPPAGKTGWPWTEQCPPLPERLPDGSRWPRISVITTSYNYEQFIEETIRSILLQGYPELDYIIIDDGSTDGSMKIIEKYGPWLAHWEQQENGEQPNATNNGFARATGDVMTFINSDDVLEPGCLECVGSAFRNGAQWVVGPIRMFGPSIGNRIRKPIPEQDPADWLGKNPVPQQGSFWSTELYRQIGPLREDFRFLFDLDYWLRLRFVAGVRPVIVDQTLAGMRFHDSSKSVSQSAGFLPEVRQLRAAYRRYLTPTQKVRSWLTEQKLTAGFHMNQAIAMATEGRRPAALGALARSLLRWPAFLFTRRAGGALRRIVAGQA